LHLFGAGRVEWPWRCHKNDKQGDIRGRKMSSLRLEVGISMHNTSHHANIYCLRKQESCGIITAIILCSTMNDIRR